jgi:hypothetical protein
MLLVIKKAKMRSHGTMPIRSAMSQGDIAFWASMETLFLLRNPSRSGSPEEGIFVLKPSIEVLPGPVNGSLNEPRTWSPRIVTLATFPRLTWFQNSP